MLNSIKVRLVLTYVLIILLTLTLVSVYIINMIRDYSVNGRKVDLLTKASILSSFAAESNFSGDLAEVNPFISMIDVAQGARVMYLDKDAKVLYDTAESGSLRGKTMLEPQIVNALKGENVDREFIIDDKAYITAAVPVVKDRNTIGAIYIQASGEDIREYTSHMTSNLLLLSVSVSLLVGVFGFAMVNMFTASLSNVTSRIKDMSDADMRKTIDIKGSNEVDELVSAFNSMVEKINDLESRRQEFVSNASHELKTPLSSIKLICDSILQTSDMERDTINDFLEDMNEEVDRLTRITNKLLSLTKLDVTAEEGEMLEFTTVNLKSLVKRVIKALTPLAKQKNIKIKTLLTDNIFIRADSDRIWEAIYNIVDNSIKYSNDGGKVYIEMYRDRGEVFITVSDNGIGMAEGETDKIFERFYRVDKARARDTGGTGLGLSIALGSVELHGGRIDAESKENEGSLFRIVLPIILGGSGS